MYDKFQMVFGWIKNGFSSLQNIKNYFEAGVFFIE